MFILQVPTTSLIHEMAQYSPWKVISLYNPVFAHLRWRKNVFERKN